MTKTNWYVVYTKSRCELKVSNLLTRKHIKNYCPLRILENQLLDSKKIILEPLFTSYVFVCIQEHQLNAVLQTPHVLNFLYWLNSPATISDEEIDAMSQLLKEYNNVKLEKYIIRPDKTLKSDGCHCSVPENTSARNQVRLVLPSLGYSLIAITEQESSHR